MPKQTVDQDTLKAIASGNEEALALVYETYFDLMFAEARRSASGDESTCMDIVQDAMVRLIRRRRLPRTTDHLEPWLRVLVRSCARDHLRAELRRRRREQRFAERRSSAPTETPDARLAWLEERIRTLDPTRMGLLMGRFKAGRTLRQIGDAAGLSASAVDGRITRTLRDMRTHAEELLDD